VVIAEFRGHSRTVAGEWIPVARQDMQAKINARQTRT
jgi:hypothetical protein